MHFPLLLFEKHRKDISVSDFNAIFQMIQATQIPFISVVSGGGRMLYMRTARRKINWSCTISMNRFHQRGIHSHSPQTWWVPPPGCRCQLCRPRPRSWSAASWCRSQLAPVWRLPTGARPSARTARTPPVSPCLSHRPTKRRHTARSFNQKLKKKKKLNISHNSQKRAQNTLTDSTYFSFEFMHV